MSTLVHFSGTDLMRIAIFAERRHVFNIATKAVSKKYDETKTEFELHYVGAMGEFAVAKVTGSMPDMRLHRGGDTGVDMVVGGQECHVKTITYNGPTPVFYVNTMEDFTAPWGIGARVVSPTKVMVTGYISREEFQAEAVDKDMGYGPRLAVSEKILKHLDKDFGGVP